jgi:hypothetical protein
MTDAHNPDGWTFATLYKHVMEISTASKEATTTAMAAAKEATLKAELASEKRLEGMNEFRSAMKDQQSTFADKEQTNFRLTAIDKKLAERDGKSQGIGVLAIVITQTILILIAIIGLAIALMRPAHAQDNNPFSGATSIDVTMTKTGMNPPVLRDETLFASGLIAENVRAKPHRPFRMRCTIDGRPINWKEHARYYRLRLAGESIDIPPDAAGPMMVLLWAGGAKCR